MNNCERWERNKQIEIEVDRIYAESDRLAFEIMARLAILGSSLVVERDALNVEVVGSSPTFLAK